MKFIKIIIVFIITNSLYSQKYTNCDYEILISCFNQLNNGHLKDTLCLDDISISFNNQNIFFTKENFKEFTFPYIGVNNKRVKKLLKKLDFEYLLKQKRELEKWDFDKFTNTIIKYSQVQKQKIKIKEKYSLSLPIYTEDKKYAFVYYETSSGVFSGGSMNVSVFIKKSNTWVFYTKFPIGTIN